MKGAFRRCVGGGGALVTALLAGCGGAGTPIDPTASSASMIQAGAPDTTHTFVVGVLQQSNQVALCSGALLAPNLVVTARHCVAQLSSDTIDCATSTFGNLLPTSDFFVTTGSQLKVHQYYAVSQIIVPTGPNTDKVCGNDIALLILQKNIPLPQYVAPALNPPMTDHSTYSKSVTAIGYGVNSPADTTGVSAGVRRIVGNVPLFCIPNDPNFVDCFPQYRGLVTPAEFVSGDASTCQGDSGSSAFDQAMFDRGQWVSFGVLSRGGVSPDGTTCVIPIYTRLDAWAQLIVDAATQAATQGVYTAPPWVSGVPFQSDGGVWTATAFVSDGTTCSADSQCKSRNCVSTDNINFLCASTCGAGSCPTQFVCTSGFCFPAPTPSSSSLDSPRPRSGGCDVAGAGRPLPASRWPLAMVGLGLATLLAARRQRRPTA